MSQIGSPVAPEFDILYSTALFLLLQSLAVTNSPGRFRTATNWRLPAVTCTDALMQHLGSRIIFNFSDEFRQSNAFCTAVRGTDIVRCLQAMGMVEW